MILGLEELVCVQCSKCTGDQPRLILASESPELNTLISYRQKYNVMCIMYYIIRFGVESNRTTTVIIDISCTF